MARIEEPKGLSATQQRLWDALADGESHPKKELRALIDQQCDDGLLARHMCNLRTLVRAMGDQTVIWEDSGYRKVRYVKEIPTS